MAEIINTAQPTIVRGVHPASSYSRVVGLSCPANNAGAQYAFTPALGNNIWILEVKCWVLTKNTDILVATNVGFYCGGAAPTSALDVMRWSNLVPKTNENNNAEMWYFHDGTEYKGWEMKVRFEGESRRLGIVAYRNSVQTDIVQVSFRISEG